MVRILIVDDEDWIRDSIRLKLERSGLPFEMILECSNADQALELVETSRIDIVLCDIRMNGQDGLTFCGFLSQKYPNIQKIIITGYSEFDYAVKAINVGVVSYLLKPIDSILLLDAISVCIERLQEDKLAKTEQSHIREFIYEKSENILLNLSSTENIQFLLNKYNEKSILVWICLYIGGKKNLSFSLILDSLLKNVGDKTFGEDLFIFRESYSEYTMMFCFNPTTQNGELKNERLRAQEKIKEIVNSIISTLQNHGVYEISCGIEEECMIPKDGFLSAKSHLYCRIFFPETQIITRSMTDDFQVEFQLDRRMILQISHALERGKYREISDLLNQIGTEIKKNKTSYRSLNVIYEELVDLVLLQEDAKDVIPRPLWQYNSIESMIAFLRDIYLSRINVTFVQNEKSKIVIANKMRDFVDNHYNQRISLEDLSKKYFVTPTYLSIVFKDVFQISFSNYLLDIRVKNAKILLCSSTYNIKTVAEMTGFNDQHYFSRVFKKSVGISPREYQKQNVHKT